MSNCSNKEVWVDIYGFEGYYQVSSFGNIRSVDRYINGSHNQERFAKGRIMKKQLNRKGYECVALHKNGNAYSKVVHRLVAQAFIPNPDDLPQVNHKDTDKTNNHVSNLEWITGIDNMRHAFANGCFDGSTNTPKQIKARNQNLLKAREKLRRPVAMLDNNEEVLGSFSSIACAQRKTGVNNSKITAVCKGYRKTAGGYKWKYQDKVFGGSDMNQVQLIGRLTRDPDVRYSTGENATVISRYTLAVDRRFKKEGESNADFISCVAFGKQGEFAEKYLHKGTKIAVVGEIRTGNYTNKDGQKVYTTDVVVNNHEFVESKGSREQTIDNDPVASGGGWSPNVDANIDEELPFN